MSTNRTWNGVSYPIPTVGDLNWQALSNFLIALADNAAVAQELKQAIRVATTSPVTVSAASDCTIVTDLGTPGAVAVNLPAGVDGQFFMIVDGKGDAGTNAVTITPNGAQTINGAASLVLNANRQAVILQYRATGTDWTVVGSYIAIGNIPINSLSGTLNINKGGTGQTTANAALNALLPTQSGNAGKILSTDASNTSWVSAFSNPMTTTGDIVYSSDNSGTPARLPGAAGVLHGAVGGAPSYSTIVNADVSASAAIAYSKLAALTSANILVGNVSNVATVTPVTGDISIDNAGVTAIASGVIVNADVNAAAAIDGSKIQAAGTSNTGTLKAYLESTWTPVPAYASGSATSVSVNSATYTKIGNKIFYACDLSWRVGTGTGQFSITGLPGTLVSNEKNGVALAYFDLVTLPSGSQVFANLGSGTGTAIVFYTKLNNASATGMQGPLTNTAFASSGSDMRVMLSGHYSIT